MSDGRKELKETIKRAVRTFVQAAVGYLAANIVMYVTGVSEGTGTLKSAVVTLAGAAVACGLAAVMNLPPKDKGSDAPSEVSDGAREVIGAEEAGAGDTAGEAVGGAEEAGAEEDGAEEAGADEVGSEEGEKKSGASREEDGYNG